MTLKDLAMLLPDDGYAQLLDAMLVSVSLMCNESTAGVNWLDTQQRQQVLQWLLQPLYLRVVAAVNKPQCHMAAAATAAASKAGPLHPCQELMECWWRVTSCLLQADGAEVVCIDSQLIRLDGVYDKDSGHSVAAIETFVRWSSSNKLDGKTIWAEGLMVGEALLGSLEHMATKGALSQDSSDLQRWLAKPAAHQQLLALFCSLLKLTASHAADCQQLRGFMTQVLKLYRKQQLQRTLACSSSSAVNQRHPRAAATTCASGQHQASGTDTTGHLSNSSYRQWAALAGRVMLVEAQEMQQHARVEITAVAEVAQKWLKVGRLLWKSKLFGKQSDKMKKNFKWLQLNLKQADRGMKEGEWTVSHRGGDFSEVLRLFSTCGPRVMETGVPNDALRDSLKRQLLSQLQRCGSAVCAVLPVRFCCNNPACVNLTQLSEQQLVAGKGSRCSGCKVARYCSRECQLKHWKQHKKTCKRIRAQRTARPTGSNAVPV